jgi:hypothetical protein
MRNESVSNFKFLRRLIFGFGLRSYNIISKSKIKNKKLYPEMFLRTYCVVRIFSVILDVMTYITMSFAQCTQNNDACFRSLHSLSF